jgi:hypothetical protein
MRSTQLRSFSRRLGSAYAGAAGCSTVNVTRSQVQACPASHRVEPGTIMCSGSPGASGDSSHAGAREAATEKAPP